MSKPKTTKKTTAKARKPAGKAAAEAPAEPKEKAPREDLCVFAFRLTAEERTQARTFLDERCTLPEAYMDTLKPEARRGIYRAACRMAVVDHVFAATERTMLDNLSKQLGISSDVAREIEADVPGLG